MGRFGDFEKSEHERSQGSKEERKWIGEVEKGVISNEHGHGMFYIFDKSWRGGTIVSVMAKQYLNMVRGAQYGREKVRQVADLGDRLVRQAGSYLEAARQVQKCNLEERDQLVGNAKEDSWAFPAVAELLVNALTHGVCPEYYGPGPTESRQGVSPYQGTQSWEIVENLRKLANEGEMLMCASLTAPLNDDLEATPCGLIPNRNPDRAICADTRLISDLRRINLGFTKSELYPSIVPMVYELAEEILRLKRRNPGIDAVTCKRDIDAAFTGVSINPDMTRLITTELRAEGL